MSALRLHFHRIAMARRAARELAAPRGKARRGSSRSRDRFRPLTESETAILGGELLAAIGGSPPRA
jgi:hypothetical protein